MASAFSSRRRYIILPFIFIVVLNGNAEEDPTGFAKALFCFSDKFIYNGCNEGYRLNQTGDINVPVEATNEFCKASCLSETEQVLSCINNMFSNFEFYNKARVQDIRKALHAGCSYTNQRGNFNIEDYLRGETSAVGLMKPIKIYIVLLAAVCNIFALP